MDTPIIEVKGNVAGNALVVKSSTDIVERILTIVPNAEKSATGTRAFIPLTFGWIITQEFGTTHCLDCRDDVAFASLSTPPPKRHELPDDYVFKNEPAQHQLGDFLAFREGARSKWHLGYDQGTGKTFSAVTISDYLSKKHGFSNTLVITGVNSVKWQWLDQIEEHTKKFGWVLGTRKRKDGSLRSSSTAEKIEDLNNVHLRRDNHFLITNIETMRDEKFVKAVQKLVEQGVIGCAIVDEAHKMRNPMAQMTKGVFKVDTPFKMTLSGTSLVNSPLDLFSTMKWLGYEEHTWTAFKNHYCIYHEFQRGRVTAYKNVDELKDRFNDIQTRVLRENVLDLPPITYQIDHVEMDTVQRKLYNAVLSQTLDELDKLSGAIHPMTVTMRLRQANNAPAILTTDKVPSCKLERLRERLQEAKEAGMSVLVFSHLKQPIYEYMKELGEFNIEVVTGDVPTDKRQEMVKRFRNKETDVLMGVISVLGTGLDIGTAQMLIFIDDPWTMSDRDQAIARSYRRGLKDALNVINISTIDTVDQLFADIVERKGLLSSYIVDNKPIPRELLIKALKGER